MFVDASAIIAIIAGESDRLSLSGRLAQAAQVFVSPIVVYEAMTGLARRRACSMDEAGQLIGAFLEEVRAEMIDVNIEFAKQAAGAFEPFGRGRHKAELNLGDCFAYACARERDLPLLFKGNDFVHTDVAVA